ncbi:MAG TPA: S8 family serine peptidase [Blastocatellia bacterium]|nr:S8 family serine peptidase [Blastocatellia bacterium]
MRLARLFFFTGLIAALPCFVFLFDAGAQATEATRRFQKREVVVELRPGASIEEVNARRRTSTIQQVYGTNFYRLRVPAGKKETKWRNKLAKDPDVLGAELNPIVTNPSLFVRATVSFPDGFATTGLSVADFNAQQGLFELLRLEEVNLRSRGAGTTVAVIDSGVDRSHPALAAKLWTNPVEQPDGIDNDGDGLADDTHGWNFVDGNNNPNEVAGDPQTTVAGHGTFIAGLIAMLAPDCQIMPIRAFPPSGMSDAFTVAAAVKYAADHGADVINLSLGSSEPSDILASAIRDARLRGITLVAAAGNDGAEIDPQFPSTLTEVIATTAIDLGSHKAAFSNFGNHIDVSAPGVSLISAYPGEGGYARWSGTSFAAPFAAGEAALLIAVDPRLPDVKSLIEEAAVNVDSLNPGLMGKLGRGRVDPLAALQSLNSRGGTRPTADVHSQIDLSRGLAGGNAFGKASITLAGSTQEFSVAAYRLNVRSSYKLVVDGNLVASDASANLGSLRFVFSTDAGRLPLAGPLNPVTNIRHIELRDALERVVLEGKFAANSDSPAAGFVERKTRLATTGVVPAAAGHSTVRIEAVGDEARREHLSVEAEGLIAGASYRLLVDGVNIGSAAARSGFLRLHLTSDGSSGHLLPPSLRPVINIKHAEVQDGNGAVVLKGDFAK